MEQELLKNNFERHGFKTSFFDTKEAALDYLKDQISGKKVAIGGGVRRLWKREVPRCT